MSIRFIALLLVFCTGCQVGKIPCPKMKSAKLNKSFRTSSSSLSARANREPESVATNSKVKDARPSDVAFIKNISVEEWDCPKPGGKKYLPKSVKDNIRKNKKKMEDDLKKEQEAASSSQ